MHYIDTVIHTCSVKHLNAMQEGISTEMLIVFVEEKINQKSNATYQPSLLPARLVLTQKTVILNGWWNGVL